MKKWLILRFIVLFVFASNLISCNDRPQEKTEDGSKKLETQIEKSTEALLQEFLVNEDMTKLSAMLDDSIKFHWPNKTILGKEDLMRECTNLVKKHDNQVEVIDVMVDGNQAFVLFIWSGAVKEDENSSLVGKEFSIHDCYRLTWQDDKITEWYTIWGSMDYLMQLGYDITPPSDG